MIRLRLSTLVFLCCLLACPALRAQEQQAEPTPFTTWIDLRQLQAGVPPASLPIWLAGVTLDQPPATDGGATRTVVQMQLRDMPGLDQKRLLRLFFDDHAGAAPTIVGLDASGAQKFSRGPLGQGLELPTSETVVIPTAGVAKVEVVVPGNGQNLRGIFFATLQPHSMMSALDFAPPSDLIDVFDRSATLQLPANDLTLYGRVKATLDEGTARFSETQPSITWEFELQALPLMTLVNFEILAADTQMPLEVTVNDRPLGAVTVSWPDLADPGYLGLVLPLETGMRFRYAGWLRAQKVIPGSALQTGVNRIMLQLPAGASPVAVRSLELLLKHNWKNLDYTVRPNQP